MNKNKVELVEFAGSDKSHALAAWASMPDEITEAKIQTIPRLLTFLADNRHTTPFEHSFLMFRVTADIATHIHFLKHRIGVSINSESARYREYTEDKYYLPDDWPQNMALFLEQQTRQAYHNYHEAINILVDSGMTRKRAKESARYFLPYNVQLHFMATFNFKSFVHFQKLRNSEHAQSEVRAVAEDMLQLVRGCGAFNLSLEAWKL